MTATFEVIAGIEDAAQTRLGSRRNAALRSSLLLLLEDDSGPSD